MSARTHFVTVAGTRLHVREEGVGPAALVLHGFTGCGESMQPVLSALQPGYRTLAVDLVGHGRSDAPPEPAAYSMERCVEHLVGVLDAFGISRAAVVGYSMGGRAALALCVRASQRIWGAALVGASAGLADAAARAERVASDTALAERIEREGVPAFVDHWMAIPLFASQKRLGAERLAAAREQRLRNRAQGLAGSLLGMGTGAQPPLHAELGALSLPFWLAVGEEDAKFREIADDLAGRLRRGRVEVIPEAGHACHLENPTAFGAGLRRFLAAAAAASEANPERVAGAAL
ncbi:MAG: 2-succinyl-6-hydroxy-2,4-cyclohexadiene-1-carboxylate synthase [Proteobacteria bacterium]|nr:2-succinyl-6-hydroxy-2,4-cyclohexadiene-1-carboxylate synthase [Pseudomonadota bacterium]